MAGVFFAESEGVTAELACVEVERDLLGGAQRLRTTQR